MPTVSLAPSASAFLGLTFLTALLATLSAFSLIFDVAADAFFLVSSGFSAPLFAAETTFLAVCLGFAAAFLAVAAASFLAGGLVVGFFLVMPADLVREPAPEVVLFFF